MLFATEHKHIGKHAAVFGFVAPRCIDRLYIAHTRHFECFVHPGKYFVAPHIIVAVHQFERFYKTVGNCAAVRRRVIAQQHHAFEFDGIYKFLDIVGQARLQMRVVGDSEIVESIEFRFEMRYEWIVFVGTFEQTTDENGFVLGEIDTFAQSREESGASPQAVIIAVLDDFESRISQKIKIVIKVTASYAELFAQVLCRVIGIPGEQNDQFKFSS